MKANPEIEKQKSTVIKTKSLINNVLRRATWAKTKVATYVNVTEETINTWLDGKAIPTQTQLLRLEELSKEVKSDAIINPIRTSGIGIRS